jgi:hypothetical protein
VTRSSRIIVSAAVAAVALASIWLAGLIPVRHVRGDPGPRAVPVAAAVVVAAGAIAAAATDLRRSGEPAPSESPRAAIALSVALAAYLVAMPIIGFVAATALVLGGVSLGLDRARRSRPASHVAVAVTIAVACWFVFVRVLNVVLPAGPWGF